MAIKILHVTSSLGGGGVAQMLVNYFERISTHEIICDFIVHGDKVGVHEKFFADRGSKIFHLPPKRSNPLQNFAAMAKIIGSGNYDAVHAHQNLSNLIPLAIAKHYRIPLRISHGHGFQSRNSIIAFGEKKMIEASATNYFACTQEVGKWLHPSRWDPKSDNTFVMKNAFDVSRFKFNKEARLAWRNKLDLGSSPALIQIGRLSEEKNHLFSLQLLQKLPRAMNWKLLIVGDGPLRDLLTDYVFRLNLTDRVKFLGYQQDIQGLLSAADIALMPSLSEGLGLAAIEAQASGIPILTSDVLPGEVQVSEAIRCLPLDLPRWVHAIAAQIKDDSRHTLENEGLQRYRIDPAVEKYKNYIIYCLAQGKAENK